MSKALREELQKLGRKGGKKSSRRMTAEQRKARASKAARAKHIALGHNVKPIQEEPAA